MVELAIYNGFTPLRRSPSDVFLDNGIGVLRATLKANGIDFVIEDNASLDYIRRYDSVEIARPLRTLFKQKFYSSQSPLDEASQNKLDTLYAQLIDFHKREMMRYLEAAVDKIKKQNIPLVGIKLWAGSTYQYCAQFCEMIHKESPNTIVVVGGPQVNCFSHDGLILKMSPFDLAVYSEGEFALVELVKACRKHKTKAKRLEEITSARIPNLIYRDRGSIVVNPTSECCVNEKPVPDYGDMTGKVPVHTIIDALGCDYGKCTFCIHPKIYPKFKKRSPELVVDEIELMVKQGIGMFTFTASDTPIPHAERMSSEILARGLNIEYTMLTRAKRNAHLHKETLVNQFRTLIKAGLKTVFLGVESGNDDVLKYVMNKGLSSNDVIHTVECIRRASRLENTSVNIITSYIFPVPLTQELTDAGITNEVIMDDNLKLLLKTKPDSFHAAPGLLYPGTKWYTEPEKFGISYEPDTFNRCWIEQEFSYHGFVDHRENFIYSFNGIEFQELLPKAIEFARKGNSLGIPSDLWEEHFTLARASGIDSSKGLQHLSEELFLDLLTCCDENTRSFYDAATLRSNEIANSNKKRF